MALSKELIDESIITALKEGFEAIKEMAKNHSENIENVTNLQKVEDIRFKTGLDLLTFADNISRKAISFENMKTTADWLAVIYQGLADFIGDSTNVENLIKDENTREAGIKLIKSLDERNKVIYEILFEEKAPDYNNVKPLAKAKQIKNEIDMKIVQQFMTLIYEACIINYEALLENAKKIMG